MEVGQKMKSRNLPNSLSLMIKHLSECLESWEHICPKPKHSEFIEGWKGTLKDHIHEVMDDDEDAELVESITEGLLEAYSAWQSDIFLDDINHEQIHALMIRPQTAQRTTDWYTEFTLRLTASEISKVFGFGFCSLFSRSNEKRFCSTFSKS